MPPPPLLKRENLNSRSDIRPHRPPQSRLLEHMRTEIRHGKPLEGAPTGEESEMEVAQSDGEDVLDGVVKDVKECLEVD